MFDRKTKLGLIATFSTLTAFALSSNAIPPLVTTIAREFKMEYATFGGFVVMLQFVCFAVASLAGGWAAQRFGLTNRVLVILGILLLGVLLVSGSTFPSFRWFVVWAVPLGFCGGLVETFSSIMLCKFGGPQSSKMCSLGQVFFCFGAIFAPTLVAFLLNYGLSWRASFITLGSLIFILGVWFIVQTRGLEEPTWEAPAANSADPAPATALPLRSDPLLYFLSAALFLYVTVEGATIVWVATYFEKHLGVTVRDAAWRLSVYWAGMLLGRSAILFLEGRWTLWPAVVIGSVGMMVCNVALSIRWSPTIATVLVFLGGLLAGPIWPVIVSISQKMRASGRFTACVIGTGALGAAFGPFASSCIIRSLGLAVFFPILSGAGVILVLCILKARSYEPARIPIPVLGSP